MKNHQTLTRFVLLAGFFLLAVSFVSQAQAREIWLNPVEAGKRGVNNWGGVKFSKEVHFQWRVPDDFETMPAQSGNATLLVIGLKDQDFNYRVNISVAGNGDTQSDFEDTDDSIEALIAGQLTEIDVSEILPTLAPGDYVALNVERASKKKVKVIIVGMRFEYEDFNAELEALKAQVAALPDTSGLAALFAGVSRTDDDIFFDGVNVHIRNGLGSTDGDPIPGDMTFDPNVNGLGNLIVGYNEARFSGSDKTGSHNLVVGPQHNYPSYGGLVAGFGNTVGISVSDGNTSVSGGSGNTASGDKSSVSGGVSNTASGNQSSVSGGFGNTASGFTSSISGGLNNTASDIQSSVSGGENNTASGLRSSVSGGENNTANNDHSSVSGGVFNVASGPDSSVSGGNVNTASGIGSSIGGGQGNTANNSFTSICCGENNTASGVLASVSGGKQNTASGLNSSVSGGSGGFAIGRESSVSGGRSNRADGVGSSVSGGTNNFVTSTGSDASINGGQLNTADFATSTVGGGNTISTTGVDDWATGP